MAYTKRDWDNTSNEVTKEDFKRIEDGIETNDKQINVLKCPSVDLPNNRLLDYIENLPIGVHRTIQFSGAVDAPTTDWYYAEIYTHVYGSRYFYVSLYPLNGDDDASYYGVCKSGTFEGWKVASGKKPFSCTAETGYTIIKQNCFTTSGVHYIDVEIDRTDSSVLTNTNATAIFSTPYAPTISNCPLNIAFLDRVKGDYSSDVFGHCYISAAKKCWYQLCNAASDTKVMRITGVLL